MKRREVECGIGGVFLRGVEWGGMFVSDGVGMRCGGSCRVQRGTLLALRAAIRRGV